MTTISSKLTEAEVKAKYESNEDTNAFTDAEKSIVGRNPSEVKIDLGLNNVNNTSDADKPVSTAQQTALDTKVASIAGTPSGGDRVANIISLTTAEYNSASKVSNTLYFLTD